MLLRLGFWMVLAKKRIITVYLFRVATSRTHFSTLGIELARLADLPADVLSNAKSVVDNISSFQARREESSKSYRSSMRRKALLRVLFNAFLHRNAYSLPVSSGRSLSKLTSILHYLIVTFSHT